MKKYFVFPLMLLLCACAVPMESTVATPLPTASVEQVVSPPAAQPAVATEPSQPIQPVPQATSRGDKLMASDPVTVQVGAGKPVLLEFFRFTCGTCRSMAPMVHGLEAKYAGKVAFFYLDADDPATREFQREYGFQYQPYFLLIDGEGRVLRRWNGFVGEQEFEAAFGEVLK